MLLNNNEMKILTNDTKSQSNCDNIGQKSNTQLLLQPTEQCEAIIVFEPETVVDLDVEQKPSHNIFSSFELINSLVEAGGWTVSVMFFFGLTLKPLLIASTNPVSLVLAMGLVTFLIIQAIGRIIHKGQK
jgi:hypothetical protein